MCILPSFHFLLEGKEEPNQKPKPTEQKPNKNPEDIHTHKKRKENKKIENKHTDQKGRYTYHIR